MDPHHAIEHLTNHIFNRRSGQGTDEERRDAQTQAQNILRRHDIVDYNRPEGSAEPHGILGGGARKSKKNKKNKLKRNTTRGQKKGKNKKSKRGKTRRHGRNKKKNLKRGKTRGKK